MFLLFTGATLVFGYYIVSDLGGIASSIENMAQLESKAGIASWSGIVGPGTEWPTAMDYLIWAFVIDIAWSAVYIVGPWQLENNQGGPGWAEQQTDPIIATRCADRVKHV